MLLSVGIPSSYGRGKQQENKLGSRSGRGQPRQKKLDKGCREKKRGPQREMWGKRGRKGPFALPKVTSPLTEKNDPWVTGAATARWPRWGGRRKKLSVGSGEKGARDSWEHRHDLPSEAGFVKTRTVGAKIAG